MIQQHEDRAGVKDSPLHRSNTAPKNMEREIASMTLPNVHSTYVALTHCILALCYIHLMFNSHIKTKTVIYFCFIVKLILRKEGVCSQLYVPFYKIGYYYRLKIKNLSVCLDIRNYKIQLKKLRSVLFIFASFLILNDYKND